MISLRVVYVFAAIEDLERFFTDKEIDYGGMIYSILENQFVFYFIEGIGKEDSGWNAYTKSVKAIDELCNYLLLCWAIIFVKLIVLSPHCTHFYNIFYVSCTLDSSSMDCSNTNIRVLRGHLMSDEPTSDLFWEDLLFMCRKTPIIYGINIQFGRKRCFLLRLRKLIVYPIDMLSGELADKYIEVIYLLTSLFLRAKSIEDQNQTRNMLRLNVTYPRNLRCYG